MAIIILVFVVVIAYATGLIARIFPSAVSTTISYWGLWEQENIIRPILDDFEKSHPGTKVVYTYQSPTQYRERLQSALSQGTGPDVFRLHNTWTPMFRSELSPVPASVISTSDFANTFYPVTGSDLRSGNGYIGVPLEYDGIAMYVNDGLLQKHNLPVPKDWDDLRAAAITMSECENETGNCTKGGNITVSGAALGTAANIDHLEDVVAVLMLQNNVNLADPTANSKAATDVLDYIAGFEKSFRTWDANLPSSTSQFAAGRVGIYFGPSWRVFDILAINPGLQFSVHPLPQLPVDPARQETPIAYASYWYEAVSRRSRNSSAAWNLVKYLSSPEVMEKFFQQAVSSGRQFGEPYSRVAMSSKVSSDRYLKAFIDQAPIARSWYLASYTHDGTTGINTRLSELYKSALNRQQPINTFTLEVNRILSDYGLVSPPPAQ